MTFEGIGLASDSDDQAVSRFAQTNAMLLLKAYRIAKCEDSLEQVMREEKQPTSLPIITIGDPDWVDESDYRERCVERLVEIVINFQGYMGAGRLFIPYDYGCIVFVGKTA